MQGPEYLWLPSLHCLLGYTVGKGVERIADQNCSCIWSFVAVWQQQIPREQTWQRMFTKHTISKVELKDDEVVTFNSHWALTWWFVASLLLKLPNTTRVYDMIQLAMSETFHYSHKLVITLRTRYYRLYNLDTCPISVLCQLAGQDFQSNTQLYFFS